MWEYSDGYNALTNTNGRMGYTEAKPIISNVNTGTAVIPAVFLSGGYNMPELPADSTDGAIPAYTKVEGKSLYVLNANTGALVAKYLYGASESTSVVNGASVHATPDFKYAITAPPTVYDTDFNGVADSVFVMESGDYRGTTGQGGRIWKIDCYGDPTTWSKSKVYQADDGQTFYIAPTLGFDSVYNLWIFAGTGRRPQATYDGDHNGTYDNTRGQILGFKNGINLSNSNLENIRTQMLAGTGFTLTAGKSGYYFEMYSAEHEILFDPSPLFIKNVVYYQSFAPEGTGGGGTSSDPCSGDSGDSGKHYLYTMGIDSGATGITISNPSVTNQRVMGYGLLSGLKYKIYVGAGEIGGFKVTSNASILLDNITGPMLWKENKN